MLKTTCKKIGDGKVIVETEGEERVLDADVVVMAIGSKPRPSDDLKAACEKAEIP